MVKRDAVITKTAAQKKRQVPTWSLVVASNNEHVLRNTLLLSPVIDSRCQVIVERDSSSAGRAYNRGLERAKADIVVFAHQDVFLPEGWFENIRRSIAQIERAGTKWAVMGVFGATCKKPASLRGFCYSAGLKCILGDPFSSPIEARTLDELVLVVRRSSGLRFDGRLPGFHLYGADICLQAATAGFKNYIVPAFCVHNSNGIVRFPREFWQAYFYLRRKWRNELPILTCCTKITKIAWPVVRHIGAEWKQRLFPRQVGKRLAHVVQFYDDLKSDHPEIVSSGFHETHRFKIGLLGATFETPNLGVSVLAVGAVRCMLNAYPEAEVFLLDYARAASIRTAQIGNSLVRVSLVNMRFSKRVWMLNNITTLLLLAVAWRMLPSPHVRQWLERKNECLGKIVAADLFGAVAGGDSFSDLYGVMRFLYVALPQLLVLILGKRLILLPQTYGPFRHRWTRFVAKWIVAHAERAWSRDRESLSELMKTTRRPIDIRRQFCFDLGFGIDSRAPKQIEIDGICIDNIKQRNLIGLNVSGLLLRNGYSGKDEFNIRSNYPEFVRAAIALLLASPDANVLLIPHVYGSGADSESDAVACEEIFATVRTAYSGRIGILRGEYGPNEIRYVIGHCGFFVGSRMHACIAAISQGIPAVSVAYSDKFLGVMRPVGADALVADARICTLEQMLGIVQRGFDRRTEHARELEARMPMIRSTVLNLMRAEPSLTIHPESPLVVA